MPDTVNFADRFAPPETAAPSTVNFADKFSAPDTVTSNNSGTTNFSDKFEAPKMVDLSGAPEDDFSAKAQQGNHYTTSLVPMTPEFADKMDRPIVPESWVKAVQPYQQRLVNAALAGGPINLPGAVYAFAKKPDPNSISAGLVQSGDEAARSLLTPANAIIGATTGGLAAEGSVAGKIITKLVSLGFGAKMASELPAQARKAVDIFEDPASTPAQKAKALSDPAITAILAGSTTIHGLSPIEGVTAEAAPDKITPISEIPAPAGSTALPELKPLPENVKVTPIVNDQTGEFYGHQIDIPNPENPEARPIFSGSPEEAAKAGYHVDFSSKFETPEQTPELDASISDYHRYQELQGKIREMTSAGADFDGPEFQALWRENEQIKNRNPDAPGMPPSAPASGETDLSESGLQKSAESLPPTEVSPEEPLSEESEKSPNYGIAARVSAARAEAGNIEAADPGEGISPEESVQHGRDLIETGRDPQAALDEFNKTNKISSDDIALWRAHGEDLAQAADAAQREFGVDSPEYKAAAKADSYWIQAIKPAQTEWHKAGQAMQGETEIDTGSFHSLSQSYREATGKEFSPAQSAEAQKIATDVTQARSAADSASQKLFDFMAEMPRSFKNSDVGQVWNLAKQYLESGETSFDDIRHKIATDMGISVDEVSKKLAAPKGSKTISDEMYAAMSKRRALESAARSWLNDQRMPGWQRFATKLPRAFFRLATLGHGNVWLVTHTSPEIFKPQEWAQLWPNWADSFRLMGAHDSGAYHERMMQDLERNPNFITARRAGLENDPSRRVDDYQKAWIGGWFNKLGLIGNRGFDGLKLLRQDLFDKNWDALPDSMKTKDQAAMLADGINHSTGASGIRFPEWMSWSFFAPKLAASQWQWMLTDPAKAARILSDWGNATDAEKSFAIRQIKEKATVAGIYATLLAANQGLLTATGSKQSVNYTDPTHSDFLKFKGAGHTLGIGSPMLGNVRLLASLVNSATGHPANYQKRESTADQMATAVAQYARGKLSPFASTTADVVTGADFQGRPLPFSDKKVPPSLHKQGIYAKYPWTEYLAGKLPIPLAEAIHEVYRKQGMDESTINHWMSAVMSGVISGATGARFTPDTNPQGK